MDTTKTASPAWYRRLKSYNWEELPPLAQSSLKQRGQEIGVDYSTGFLFKYGEVPLRTLASEIMKSDVGDDFDSFEEYHNWYIGRGMRNRGAPSGAASRWPSILAPSGWGEVFADGWHRFHQAVAAKSRSMPVVLPVPNMTKKTAGVWDSLKRLWKKWTGKPSYQGPSRTEDSVVDAFATDLAKTAIAPQSKAFVRQVAVEASKAGVPSEYLPYIFWLITEKRDGWPPLDPGQAEALSIARSLTLSEGDMPFYTSTMTVPPVEMESRVDQAIDKVAMWAWGPMSAKMLRGYSAALKKWAPQMASVATELPPDKSATYLKMLFEAHLSRNPDRFLDGPLMERVVAELFK